MLSPVEIKSKMSHVTFGVTGVVALPPVVSEREHLLFCQYLC